MKLPKNPNNTAMNEWTWVALEYSKLLGTENMAEQNGTERQEKNSQEK